MKSRGARENEEAAWMCRIRAASRVPFRPRRYLTRTGVLLLAVLPLPSCPYVLFPQQNP